MSVVIDTVIFHRDFGDLHSTSIDEPYYRSAVLQHEYDRHAYVFSVPFDAGNQSLTAVTFHHFIHTFFLIVVRTYEIGVWILFYAYSDFESYRSMYFGNVIVCFVLC